MNSKQLSSRRLTNKWLVLALVALSFASFLVSAYLTVEHFLGELPTCTILEGCEEVAKSKYSQVGPIPISLFGVFYFLLLLALLVFYLDREHEMALKIFTLFTIPGFFISLVLLWLQFWIIGAVCIYCLIVDISSVLIFFAAIYLYIFVLQKKS